MTQSGERRLIKSVEIYETARKNSQPISLAAPATINCGDLAIEILIARQYLLLLEELFEINCLGP